MPEVKSMFREVLPKQGEVFHCCCCFVQQTCIFCSAQLSKSHPYTDWGERRPHDNQNNRRPGVHSSTLVQILLQTPSAWGLCCVLSVQVSFPWRTFPPWSCANPNSCLWSLWRWRNWRRCSRKLRRSSNNKNWLWRSSSLREQSRAWSTHFHHNLISAHITNTVSHRSTFRRKVFIFVCYFGRNYIYAWV